MQLTFYTGQNRLGDFSPVQLHNRICPIVQRRLESLPDFARSQT